MSLPGTMGKILFVDLTTGTMTEETPPDEFYKDYLGGYGFGAHYLFQRQKPGVDALGPDNMLGFLTGVLTGAPGISTNRFTVVAKSPKTGTWGDANCGGWFGPALKRAGFDGVMFTGQSQQPVYLLCQDGEAKLLPADEWWGLDTNVTEEKAKALYGKTAQIATIGASGENKRLLACIINDLGRAAGRSGLGAVMGAKNLKAIVAVGGAKPQLADPDGFKAKVREYREIMKQQPFYGALHEYGTGGGTATCVATGDAGIKNWAGSVEDMPHADNIGGDSLKAIEKRKYACWGCSIACGGRTETGEPFAADHHKPEYETLGAFGSMCLNDNLASINKANEICNRAGLDTISTGCTIAFAIECFENGLITTEDTGGVELRWGNPEAVVRMTELIARDEGFGAVLADGAKVAAERIGKGAEQYAMHVGGEEIPMHDPRLNPSLGVTYTMDATPARHTQINAWAVEAGFSPPGLDCPPVERYTYSGKGEANRLMSTYFHAVNAAGMCMFTASNLPTQALVDQINLVTGKELTLDDVLTIGHRLATLRIMFNLREGVRNVDVPLPGRMLGTPPLEAGPLEGITIDNDTQVRDYCQAMGWDPETGVPTDETLKSLRLDFTIGSAS